MGFPAGRNLVFVTVADDAGAAGAVTETVVRVAAEVTPIETGSNTVETDGGGLFDVQVAGGGSAEVLSPDVTDTDGILIRLDGTNDRTSVKVLPSNGATTMLSGDIVVTNGSLRSIVAPNVKLAGDVRVDGTLSKLQLGGIEAGHLVVVGGDPAGRNTLAMDLGVVGDLQVTSQTPLKSVQVVEWLDGDGTRDTITAPSISRIVVTGDRRTDEPGDFDANLVLTGTEKGRSLGRMDVKGAITGGEWQVTGDIGTIQATDISEDWLLEVDGVVRRISSRDGLAGTLTAEQFGRIDARGDLTADITATGEKTNGESITEIRAAAVADVNVSAPGGINRIQVQEWADGSIVARWLRRLQVTGSRRLGIAGDFSADVDLTEAVAGRGLSLLKVAGQLVDADVRTAGDAGIVDIGGLLNSRILVGLKADVTGTPGSSDDFEASGVIDRLLLGRTSQPVSVIDSVIAAREVGTGVLNMAPDAGGGAPPSITSVLVSDLIRSYTRRTGVTRVLLRRLDAPGLFDQDDNYELRLV